MTSKCPKCGREGAPADGSSLTEGTVCAECRQELETSTEILAEDSVLVIDESPRQPTATSPPAQARRPCPKCGEEVAISAKKCRFCGEVFDPELKKTRGWRRGSNKKPNRFVRAIAIAGAVVAVICAIVFLSFLQNSARDGAPSGPKRSGAPTKFDASNDQTVSNSLEGMLAESSAKDPSEFLDEVMSAAALDEFLSQPDLDVVDFSHFKADAQHLKPLHGMTAAQIHKRAERYTAEVKRRAATKGSKEDRSQ